ncbi:hypothetical protein HD554DRAFT_2274242 [Boletus coccyginus]|nr:hypothetical protein HD554DRAFT_2274242 [Boletus coccyginus]
MPKLRLSNKVIAIFRICRICFWAVLPVLQPFSQSSQWTANIIVFLRRWDRYQGAGPELALRVSSLCGVWDCHPGEIWGNVIDGRDIKPERSRLLWFLASFISSFISIVCNIHSVMGAVLSSIGSAINSIISAIARLIMTIVDAVTVVLLRIWDLFMDILCCRCGSRSRRYGTSRRLRTGRRMF